MSRILLTGFFELPAPSRVGVQMRHVARALAVYHQVDALVMRGQDQAYSEHRHGARVLRVPVAGPELNEQLEGFRQALRRQLEGTDYDLVHVRDGWAGAVVLELRERRGYTTVFDAARAPMAEPPIMDLTVAAELARGEEGCLVGADHVLVPTEAARQHVLRRRSKGVHLVPPGVDVDLFDWDDMPGGPPLVVYAGAVESGRGLLGLLRAMASLAPRSEARLVIAGRASADTRATLGNAIAELGLHDRVELVGELPYETVPALLAQATVCVAPSAAEVSAQPMALYPTKLLEYMACRRAVVAPRRGSATMLIEDGVTGLLFRPGDPEDLARQLLRVVHDADLRARLADAGYHLVRQYHTASATRRALRKAYGGMPLGPRQILSPVDTQPLVPVLLSGQRSEPAIPVRDDDRTDPFASALRAPDPEATAVDRVALPVVEGGRADGGASNSVGSGEIPATSPMPALYVPGDSGELDRTEVELIRDTVREPAPVAQGAEAPEPPLAPTRQLPSLSLIPTQLPTIPPVAAKPEPPRRSATADPEQASRDYRSVAGELEVSPAKEPSQDEDSPFEAVSVLLGGMSEDGGDGMP
ncbi:glycosyltransferase [Haliangium sp.]|uniref:glycosyltransferase family 4 protein n=1 Tax=Haliangium sp. TaxID=2663208 RepID=UPI003D0F499A